MLVDSQVHIWTAETPERPWPAGGAERAHSKDPLTYPRMLEIMDSAGVDRVVIVPPSWEGDRNDYALEAALRFPRRFAVMGRIALDDELSRENISTWLAASGMLGIRVTFSRKQAEWLSDGTADWFWSASERAGIPVMLHGPGLGAKIGVIASSHPALNLIIDHMGLSGEIKQNKAIPSAIAETCALAVHSNVSVKVSSIPSYSSESFPFRDMDQHVKNVVDVFGAERCFWGSDLTHAHGKFSYKDYVNHVTHNLEFLSTRQRKLIMGEAILDLLKWPM